MYKYDERKEKIILSSPEIEIVPFDMSYLNHLTEQEKTWVLSFISKIKNKNPNWNFNVLYNNLRTLTFEKKNLVLEKCSGTYDIRRNTISYSNPQSIFHELIHASTSIKDKNQFYCGLEQIRKKLRAISIGKGLNEGYTNLLESRYDICHGFYIPEMEISKNLDKAVPGLEEMYNNMNLLGLISYLENINSKSEAIAFLEMLDYIHIQVQILKSAKPKEIIDLYYECQIYTFSCLITKLLQDIENGKITLEKAQNILNIAIRLTLTTIMTGKKILEVSHLERLQDNVPDLSHITREDIKTYKLKI